MPRLQLKKDNASTAPAAATPAPAPRSGGPPHRIADAAGPLASSKSMTAPDPWRTAPTQHLEVRCDYDLKAK